MENATVVTGGAGYYKRITKHRSLLYERFSEKSCLLAFTAYLRFYALR